MVLMWLSEVFWDPELDRPGKRPATVEPDRPPAPLSVAPPAPPAVQIDLPQVNAESW